MPPPLHFPAAFRAWFVLAGLKGRRVLAGFQRGVLYMCIPSVAKLPQEQHILSVPLPCPACAGAFTRGEYSPGLAEALTLCIYIHQSNVCSQCWSGLNKFMPKSVQFHTHRHLRQIPHQVLLSLRNKWKHSLCAPGLTPVPSYKDKREKQTYK